MAARLLRQAAEADRQALLSASPAPCVEQKKACIEDDLYDLSKALHAMDGEDEEESVTEGTQSSTTPRSSTPDTAPSSAVLPTVLHWVRQIIAEKRPSKKRSRSPSDSWQVEERAADAVSMALLWSSALQKNAVAASLPTEATVSPHSSPSPSLTDTTAAAALVEGLIRWYERPTHGDGQSEGDEREAERSRREAADKGLAVASPSPPPPAPAPRPFVAGTHKNSFKVAFSAYRQPSPPPERRASFSSQTAPPPTAPPPAVPPAPPPQQLPSFSSFSSQSAPAAPHQRPPFSASLPQSEPSAPPSQQTYMQPPPPEQRADGAVGDFRSAADQLMSAIASGKTSAIHGAVLKSKGGAGQPRTPALGLRRRGFQAPFQPSSPPQADAAPLASAAPTPAPPPPTAAVVSAVPEGFPVSLLEADGTVPPSLQGLDSKLLSQVASEIVPYNSNGVGAVSWEDIAGLSHAKRAVEEAIVWPLCRPDLFVGLRDPPRGLLLFGPPGTGKTLIARAIASRAKCTFFGISASSLMSKWYGEAEQLVRCLFVVAALRQPSVIFVDEVDSLLSVRGEGGSDAERRLKTEFLVQMDGVGTHSSDRILLIGATNRPKDLDEAARRRLEKRLYIPLPNADARRELIQRLLLSLSSAEAVEVSSGNVEGESDRRAAAPAPHSLSAQDLESLVTATEGFSGADLRQLLREAAMAPIRDAAAMDVNWTRIAATDLRPLTYDDFHTALHHLKPSVGPSEITAYETWNATFGSFAVNA